MKHLFISRDITKDNLFVQHLASQGVHVSGQSFITFSPVLFNDIPTTDWIFFYSKRAAHFFFDRLNQLEFTLSASIKLAAMGAGTANTITELLGRCDFIGAGQPKETTVQFLEVAKNARVLFPRAMHSQKSVQNNLLGQVEIKDLVVYDNKPVAQIPLQKADLLLFTSPMNAKTYFSKHTLLPYQQVIAIGPTTFASLVNLGISNPLLADNPEEERLAKFVLGII